LLDEALELARQAGDRAGEAEVLRTRGLVDLTTGAVDPAEERVQRSLEIATTIGDVEQTAKAQVNLALVDKLRGRYGAARARRELAVLTNLSAILLDLGEFEAAEAACREVLPLARGLGDQASQAASLVNLGFFEARRGMLAEAHQHFAEGVALGTWVRDNPMTLFVEARIEYESGRYAHAGALMRALKARFVQAWEAQNEGLLERYEEAARLGRRVALPPPEH
jgi:Tfp pilus assembly protein PilF